VRKFSYIALVPVLVILTFLGGPANESEGQIFRPFRGRLRSLTLPCNQSPEVRTIEPTCPNITGPCAELPMDDPVVPQPWLHGELMGDSFSPVQATVLDPVPGTGSAFGIGAKKPNPESPQKDNAEKAILDLLRKPGLLGKPEVAITLPLEEQTSQRLSRISLIVEILLWLLGGSAGMTLGGKLLPLVARLVSGLRLSESEISSQSKQLPSGAQLPQANQLIRDNQAGP